MTILTIILTALLPMYAGLKDSYMFMDLGTGTDGQDKKKWHAVDLVFQVAAIAYLSAQLATGKEVFVWAFAGAALAASAWFWLVQDVIVNVVGLGVPAFYIGTTSETDKLLRRIFGKDAGFWLAGFKVGMVIVGIFIFVIS